MAGRLDGRVALVTGAARGMGASHARKIVAEGGSVVIADIRDEEGTLLAKEIGDQAAYAHLDVTSESDWAAAVSVAVERFGGLNILVNNAGISAIEPIATMALEKYRRVIEVNQVGVFLGMKAAIPALIESGNGSIVNISSTSGMSGSPGLVGYVASKYAVRGMTKVAALELGALNVRANSIHPGGVHTPMLDEMPEFDGVDIDAMVASQNPLGRIGTVEDISELVVYLASDAAAYCTGAEFVIDGGMTAGTFVQSLGEATEAAAGD